MVYSLAPTKIHEVGCGEGNLITRYVDGKRQLIASDFSQQLILQAQQQYAPSGIIFKASSIYDLDSSDSAPCVLCCEVMEHLEEPERALEKLTKLADPYLIISVPREPIWRVLNMARGAYLKDWGNTPGHLQHWSKKQFVEFLSSKFEILAVHSPFPWTMVLCKSKA